MKAPAILHAALDTLVQRGVKRDQPDGERSMPRIVRVYEAITGIRLTEREGLLFMVSLKLVREGRGAPDPDDYVDLVNYIALTGEAALAEVATDTPVDEPAYAAERAHRELHDLLRVRKEQLQASVYSGGVDGPHATARPCRVCAGTGNCAIDPANYVRCPLCDGTGTRHWTACTHCAGNPGWGKVRDSSTPQFCRHCRGVGEVPVTANAARGPYTLGDAGNLSGPRGTHNLADVPEGRCPVCAGDGFENRKLGTLCRTCSGTGQC